MPVAANGTTTRIILPSQLLVALLFLFIYGWKISALVDIVLVTSAALAILVFIYGQGALQRRATILMAALLLVTCYSWATVVLNSSSDPDLGLRAVRVLINCLGGLALAILYYWRYGQAMARSVMLHTYYCIAAHGTLMLGMYANDNLRRLILSITSADDYVNLFPSYLSGKRITGLTYGLAQTSVVQMFGLILLPFLLQQNRERPKTLVALLVTGPIIVISILISGRSGILLGLVAVPLAVLLGQSSLRSQTPGRHGTMILAFVALVLFTGAVFWLGPNILPEKFETFTIAESEEVLEFFANRGETETTRNLAEGLQTPSTSLETLFGQGNMDRRIINDSGYVLVLFGLGVIGSALYYVAFLVGLNISFRSLRFSGDLSAVTIAMLASTLLLHIKENAIYTRNQWSIQAFLLGAITIAQVINRNPARPKWREANRNASRGPGFSPAPGHPWTPSTERGD